ncbi:hypothetical protein [Streptomyces sp. NBC_01445]|uniref:hypothetical protein n=1 Tax=Streptomyces sp. NBC_01445 TaxID=2903869 RepID=UPI002DD8534B|nr:hypothetical protein [Streptomyces sp. NBC_01445]WSE08958.1 hypothetical protein OG574_39700 [Streptomyces sp. NBC_01445]
MVIAAGDPWYQSALFVGIVSGLLGAAGGVVAVFMQGRRLRLRWAERANTSLLSTSDPDLAVFHGGAPVTNPRVVRLEIWNPSRREVTSDKFNNDGLVFDFKTPIVAVLSAESTPVTRVAPSTLIAGEHLEINPALLAVKQRCTYTVLVDGPEERVVTSFDPFVGVTITRELTVDEQQRQQLFSVLAGGVSFAFLLVGTVLVWLR